MFIRSKIQFFESKSQQGIIISGILNVVYQIKDTIFWKQITTGGNAFSLFSCCLSDQRYNFLKANHNTAAVTAESAVVVYQIKDTIFWKQITTAIAVIFSRNKLFIRSKIQFFESKSQQAYRTWSGNAGCLSDQRYNFLKANHNQINRTTQYPELFIRSKIQFFESKSQLSQDPYFRWYSCLSDQRYNFLKANHNTFGHTRHVGCVVYQIKDTIFWKQITTRLNLCCNSFSLFIRSKIQFFESKSQQLKRPITYAIVVYQIKDTIFWKQITTDERSFAQRLKLFIRSKIQFFESKSQLLSSGIIFQPSCLSDQRYNFLKANHN